MRKLFLIITVLLYLSPGHAAQTISVASRDGVTQSFLLLERQDAAATVLLFPGGDGVLQLGIDGNIGRQSNNFLVRTRHDFLHAGLHVAILDAPSDHQAGKGMLYGFRSSAEHAADIQAVVDELQRRYAKPVWLVGTSRGTESVANAAIRQPRGVAGIVLTSSMSVPNAKGSALPEMQLERINLPVLIAAHHDDPCAVTPASGAETIRAGLHNASRVELRMFSGGGPGRGRDCGAMTEHGFIGIEQQVVDAIAGFILR